jgi:hypothetical protein
MMWTGLQARGSSAPGKRFRVAACAALLAGGIWTTASVHSSAAGPVSPADKSCQGPGGGTVSAGQLDTCTVTVATAGAPFFPITTTFVLTLTGPAGATFTSCVGNNVWDHVTGTTATTCSLQVIAAGAVAGAVLATEGITIAAGTATGAKVAQTLTFPGFPAFDVPVTGSGATVTAAAATATPTATPKPKPKKIIKTPATGAGVDPLAPILIVVGGVSLVGTIAVGRRRRS